jgi:alpha-galactosidase
MKAAVCAGVAAGPARILANMDTPARFPSVLRSPDLVRVLDIDNSVLPVEKQGDTWKGKDFEVTVTPGAEGLKVALNSRGTVAKIQLRWNAETGFRHYQGDAWERSYADLAWQGEAPNRVMPWYFLAHDGRRTHGYGVKTGPGALCFWNADRSGISLWADVCSGGSPVRLGDRTLLVAEAVCREGRDGETPFQAAQAFCRQMCPNPRLPKQPVYGTNDWDFAYGNSSAELIAGMASALVEVSPKGDNRPFSVIDEGWAMGPYENNFGHGPWVGNPKFGDMGKVAGRLKGIGVRPGIWYRPLTPLAGTSETWRLQRDRSLLDPTIPEVLAQVADHIRRFVGWGYEMVKHDYTTVDIFGQFGMRMGATPARPGWSLHDSAKTNAEVAAQLYGTIRAAAGDAYLIGCNTLSHLAAGTHEVQRAGDDTSGTSWDRTRRMGVNTLAFRAAQHGAFYTVDPDIVAITKAIPWSLSSQWLRLVAESGTALFVAIEPGVLDSAQRETVRKAVGAAAAPQAVGEPLDWMDTLCPTRWKLRGREVSFDWMGPEGSWPYGD